MNRVVLQRANHLETRAIANVREPGILVPAEIPLKNAAVTRAVEHCTPRFELTHTIRSFLRVTLGHSPVVHVLATSHCVREVDFPVVTIVDVRERCSNATLCHHRVSFAEERFTDEPDASA
jgi:hypothetical protein